MTVSDVSCFLIGFAIVGLISFSIVFILNKVFYVDYKKLSGMLGIAWVLLYFLCVFVPFFISGVKPGFETAYSPDQLDRVAGQYSLITAIVGYALSHDMFVYALMAVTVMLLLKGEFFKNENVEYVAKSLIFIFYSVIVFESQKYLHVLNFALE
ncbi:hypothetical protein [Hahella sp. NBU794]|uniref:hypothetical protein n=1 Tax=Hahella sp. NBU794 TaxID=3422590 RepID=UPI003D6FE92B